MNKKKIFILLPDGVGLRNFAYTNFYKVGKTRGHDMVFWNNTPFDLSDLGLKETRIVNPRPRPYTDLLKRARTLIDLKLSAKRENNDVYDNYIFPMAYRDLKSAIKNTIVKFLVWKYRSDHGVSIIRKKIKASERSGEYYKACLQTLRQEKPDFVFCTNQRPLTAISPILAAQDLGIPTATFIFSWDNIPKATMVIETDYYFVWSDYMKRELMSYYPYIADDQIIITGTPQFELHHDTERLLPRDEFFKNHKLNADTQYICFSGDDITSSPNDPQYLADVAQAVREINADGRQIGIIFRRCPVDFSNRYDHVLEKYADVITRIAPLWKKMGEIWNTILPTPEDMSLQLNTIAHTEMVVNLGSSMIFDYAAFNKPCAFISYEVPNEDHPAWTIEKIYKYVHFRSMPTQNCVIWLDDPTKIKFKLLAALQDSRLNVDDANKWFQIINMHPIESASQRIIDSISEIIDKKIK